MAAQGSKVYTVEVVDAIESYYVIHELVSVHRTREKAEEAAVSLPDDYRITEWDLTEE